MYERGYTRDQVLRLFHVIDWMMALPHELEAQFLDDVHLIEEETKMPYINTAERAGIRKGIEQGRLAGEREVVRRLLVRRFGALSGEAEQRLAEASIEELESWADNILDAPSLEAVFTSLH